MLSLSCVFPNPAEPGLGPFVLSRLSAVGKLAAVNVIAPTPVYDYSNPKGRIYNPRTFPAVRVDGPLKILHPRWIFPPLGTPLNVFCLFLRLYPIARLLRRSFAFDLIDAHFGYPDGVAAALLSRAFGVPYTITLRGSELVFGTYRYRRLVMSWAFRHACRIIAVSEELRQFSIAQGAAPDRVVTIPNGIDQTTFHPRNRAEIRMKRGISPKRKVVVSAGELIEAKGHQYVAQAVHDLVVEGSDVELLIVGSTGRGGPSYEITLREFVASLGWADRIRFIGWTDRTGVAAALLSAADLFCLASHTEGCPNVVHEALACGTPIVASRVGAIPSMIPSTDYGLIIPVRDQKALLGALRSALAIDWDREKIARWGGARTWSEVAREVSCVFEAVLRESAPHNFQIGESQARIGDAP